MNSGQLTIILGFWLITVLCAPVTFSQSRADSLAIRSTALDYAQGWYTGNADRMTKALHPKLAKRALLPMQNGELELDEMNATQLIEATRKGYGKTLPPNQQVADVRILDIFGNTATVRLEMRRWIDYLHIIKENDEWRIINVLWELKPKEE